MHEDLRHFRRRSYELAPPWEIVQRLAIAVGCVASVLFLVTCALGWS